MKWTEIEIKNFAIPTKTETAQEESPLELEQIRYTTATNLI